MGSRQGGNVEGANAGLMQRRVRLLFFRLLFSCLYELGPNCVSNQGCGGMHTELAHSGCSMCFHSFYADVQARADAFVAEPLRDQFNNHALSGRKRLVRITLFFQRAIQFTREGAFVEWPVNDQRLHGSQKRLVRIRLQQECAGSCLKRLQCERIRGLLSRAGRVGRARAIRLRGPRGLTPIAGS